MSIIRNAMIINTLTLARGLYECREAQLSNELFVQVGVVVLHRDAAGHLLFWHCSWLLFGPNLSFLSRGLPPTNGNDTYKLM
jgi:hypothetical protein